MIKRIIQEKAMHLSRKYPVLTVTGPRQSGKTTLVRNLFPSHEYFNLENPVTRRIIEDDPAVLFQPPGRKVIIDEIQKFPELLSYIQINADEQKENGQFVITGSQSMMLSEKISQTLTGRTAILKLLPFSLSELISTGNYSESSYENWIHRGFYPRMYDQDIKPDEFYPFYFETYLQRDVREIQNIRDLNQFTNFVRLCAGRIGQILDYSSLANDAGVSVNTAKSWLSVLEASYVTFFLHPYYRNFNKRIIKSPKLYFVDTGLASFLLNIVDPAQIPTHYLRGNLFENLIIAELLKGRLNKAQLPNMYFFRDSNKVEVDCIIEDPSIHALEIKSSTTFSPAFIDGLKIFSRNAGVAPEDSYVIYGGNDSYQFKGYNIRSWKTAGDFNDRSK